VAAVRGSKYKPTVAFPGSGENERPLAQAVTAAKQAKEAADAPPFATGALAADITFQAGQTVRVPHGLGRKPQGWLVVYATRSAPELCALTSDAYYISLVHGGGAVTTCSLYFF
jgi:hypothetical protein